MNRRLGVALLVAFVLHAVLFTLLHVRRGPAPEKPVAKAAPTPFELETTSVALGEPTAAGLRSGFARAFREFGTHAGTVGENAKFENLGHGAFLQKRCRFAYPKPT